MGVKDVIILQLFFTFLGQHFSNKHGTFVKQAAKYLSELKAAGTLEFKLNPEGHFAFTEGIKKKVKELLIGSNEEQFSSAAKLPIFDILTNILLEAMQFSGLIPHPLENELESMQVGRKEARGQLRRAEKLLAAL